MIRDERNKRPAGSDRTRRSASSMAGRPSQNSQMNRPVGSGRRPAAGGQRQAPGGGEVRTSRQSPYYAYGGQNPAYGSASARGRSPAAAYGSSQARGQSPILGGPSPGGKVQRDFDREAARRRIEERRRKLEIKERRKEAKQEKKHKNLRSKKRRRAKRIRALTMALAVFVLFFFVWPHVTDRVGETAEAEPVAAMQQQESQKETEKKDGSQMETNARNTSSEYLILVNKTHALKADYEPGDLVQGKPAVSGGSSYQQMRKTAADAFKKLSDTAKEHGYTIKITSGYRPYAYQKQLFERYVDKDGRYSAEQYSAEPGHSEHQTGLVADVSSPSVNYNLVQAYGTTEEGVWLAKNAHKFGFIIRFPKGKEDITGYKYEPWHIRYVGKDAAKEIYRQKLTLEEYLEQT